MNIELVAKEIKELHLAGEDCLVVDLWSNSSFLGSDENGYPLRPTKSAVDGRYHIEGDLQVAHKGVFQRIYQDATPIFDVAHPAEIIVFFPIPRYVIGKCCERDEHISNFGTADFLDEIVGCVDLVKTATAGLRSLGKSRTLSVMDLLATTDPNRTVTERLTDPAIWSDPVHMANNIYVGLAGSILEMRAAMVTEATPQKRIRLDSVVSANPNRQRGPKKVALPSWVLGKGPAGASNRPGSWRGGRGLRWTGRSAGRGSACGVWRGPSGGRGRGRSFGRGN